jgi:hypothetical protein
MTDDELGQRMIQTRIKSLISQDKTLMIPEFLESEKFTSTKTRLIRDATTQLLFKQFTAVFNVPGTVMVIDFTLPCDIHLSKCSFTSSWRILHVDSTRKTAYHAGNTTSTSEITGSFIPSGSGSPTVVHQNVSVQ